MDVIATLNDLSFDRNNIINTFTADNTTAALAWERRGVTRSTIL